MPVTFWTLLIGALALSGVPPFSGFYSKDSILAQRWNRIITCCLRRCFRRRADCVLHLRCSSRLLRSGEIQSRFARARIAAGDDVAAAGAGTVRAIAGFIGITNNYGSQFIAGNETLSVRSKSPSHSKTSARCFATGRRGSWHLCGVLALQKCRLGPAACQARGLATAMKNKFTSTSFTRPLSSARTIHRHGDGCD